MQKQTHKWEHSHRQWPLPKLPWVMRQSWNNLLFIHYPVSVDLLRRYVPEQLSIDTFEGQGWISVVPFKMEGVGLRAVPFSLDFPELNVRTYITIDGKPGVYFFSLDASNFPFVFTSKNVLNLPYIQAKMSMHIENGKTTFISKRTRNEHIQLNCKYKATSEPFFANPHTLEYWLTERYCFYNMMRSGKVKRCDILHEPWPIQQAEVEIVQNTLPIMSQLNIEHVKPLVYYSKGVDVRVWNMVQV